MRAINVALLSAFGFAVFTSKKELTMKLTTIALASAFALSGTFAFAQAGGPNGTAGGHVIERHRSFHERRRFTRRGWP